MVDGLEGWRFIDSVMLDRPFIVKGSETLAHQFFVLLVTLSPRIFVITIREERACPIIRWNASPVIHSFASVIRFHSLPA